jgi:hypothetical protein
MGLTSSTGWMKEVNASEEILGHFLCLDCEKSF